MGRKQTIRYVTCRRRVRVIERVTQSHRPRKIRTRLSVAGHKAQENLGLSVPQKNLWPNLKNQHRAGVAGTFCPQWQRQRQQCESDSALRFQPRRLKPGHCTSAEATWMSVMWSMYTAFGTFWLRVRQQQQQLLGLKPKWGWTEHFRFSGANQNAEISCVFWEQLNDNGMVTQIQLCPLPDSRPKKILKNPTILSVFVSDARFCKNQNEANLSVSGLQEPIRARSYSG